MTERIICDIDLAEEIICDAQTVVIGANEFMRYGKLYYVSDELKEIAMNRCWNELEKYLEKLEKELG